MTLFGWDLSHYDGHITAAIARRAAAEGIVFATHKVGEGVGGDDPEDGTALAALRDAGVACLGGYHVVRSGPVAPQVAAALALADRDEPWWRDWPTWAWQVDLERWPNDPVPAATGVAFGQLLALQSGKPVLMYASHGQYQNQLAGWGGQLWNADYVSAPAGSPQSMYPGDAWMPNHGSWRGGWAPYSGKAPALLQFTSGAVIAGLTTCDANAFRGSLLELHALFGAVPPPPPSPGDDMTPEEHTWLEETHQWVKDVRYALFTADPGTPTRPADSLAGRIDDTQAAVALLGGATPTGGLTALEQAAALRAAADTLDPPTAH